MAVYHPPTNNTFNGFEYCAGHRPSPSGDVNSHGLHATRSHPFIIILQNPACKRLQFKYGTLQLWLKKCRCMIPHQPIPNEMEFINFLRIWIFSKGLTILLDALCASAQKIFCTDSLSYSESRDSGMYKLNVLHML